MSYSESLFDNIETEADLPLEVMRFSNAIKTISNIQPKKGKQMYIYKPVITYDRLTVNEIKNITNPSEIADLFRSLIMGPIEKVAVIFLNCRNDIVERILFSDMFCGTVDQSQFYPREILKMALLNNSSRIIICHNHPSGHLSPSTADNAITKVMRDSAKLLGIELLDHLIITEDGFYSFQEQGGI